MEDIDDDFGELYAALEFHPTSAINVTPRPHPTQFDSDSSPQTLQKHDQFHEHSTFGISDDSSDEEHLCKSGVKMGDDEMRENDLVLGIGEVGERNESDRDDDEDEDEDDDDEDDFDVVVNDEDFGAKNGGVEGRRIGEEARENVNGVEFRVSEAKLNGNGTNHGGGGGGKLIGGNSLYKYVRQCGSVSTSNPRATSLMRADIENIGHYHPKRSPMGRFRPTYAGSADHGNGFWLPRNRTILDVDIGSFEQKPWTNPGGDMTDYFNFGFDEESWRSYCQSLGQLRQQTFTLTRSHVNGNLGSKHEIEAGVTRELDFKEVARQEFFTDGHRRLSSQDSYSAMGQFNWQIGQAIFVEDSNIERQPSMDVKPPRNCDSDVIIEITMQEPEHPSDSLKEQDNKLEVKSQILEKECVHGKVVQESQKSSASEVYKMERTSTKEFVQSQSSSSDPRRSHVSGTVSRHVLETCFQTEGLNSDSDKRESGEVDAILVVDPKTLKTLSEDSNSEGISTAINPCVAGLDLLSDGHFQSSTTSSYSDIHSEASSDKDRCDSRHPRCSRRLSPDSVMERSQAAEDDYCRSQVSKKDVMERKGSCPKYYSRVRSSTEDHNHHRHSRRLSPDSVTEKSQVAEYDYCHSQVSKKDVIERKGSSPKYYSRARSSPEDHRHSQKSSQRRSELKNCNLKNDDYHRGRPENMLSRFHSRHHHRTREEWHRASGFIDEDWPGFGEKECSLANSDRGSAECIGDSHQRDHWGSRDEISLYSQRGWGEGQHFSKSTRQVRGDVEYSDWCLDERVAFREEKHPSPDQPHFSSKYFSSIDWELQYRHWEYDDFRLSKRSKHHRQIEARHCGRPIPDRYVHRILNARQRECLDLEVEHQRHLRNIRRETSVFGREDELFDNQSLDLSYQLCHRENLEYHSEQAFPSIYDEADVYQFTQRYDKHSRRVFVNKSSDRQLCNNWNAYGREDAGPNIDENEYLEKRHIFQAKGMEWENDVLFESNLNNPFCDEDILDPFKGNPRCNWHGAKQRFMSGQKIIRTQGMKDRPGVISSAKYFDRTSTVPIKAKHGHTGLWCRNPLKLQNIRERKWSRNLSRLGSVPIIDARANVDGRSQKHLQEQQGLEASYSKKAMTSKGLRVEASKDRALITNHEDVPGLEEGQIPTEKPCTNIPKVNKSDSGGLTLKDNIKGRLYSNQKSMNRDCHVYDESRILETMAKMEKRRERFKEPTRVKVDTDSIPKHQAHELLEPAKSKGQRPMRKRQWVGN